MPARAQLGQYRTHSLGSGRLRKSGQHSLKAMRHRLRLRGISRNGLVLSLGCRFSQRG